jgi:hypothetical protein
MDDRVTIDIVDTRHDALPGLLQRQPLAIDFCLTEARL